ncbi:MAG: TLD domain-containing protein, partial [Formivibrio sp.]|nr:TLD domain-containing protein [Formivibrio sp.]
LAAFLRELSVWLPRRAYTLLYRGSRDGMTAAAFHGLCDGKGPTLVLVRCEEGWVFGGHADASWVSPPSGVYKMIGSGEAFLFSVTGPYTSAPVRLPVKADEADRALGCHADCGPSFRAGLAACAGSMSPTDCFDKAGSCCYVGESWSCFDDVIGRGDDTLTGAKHFLPTDIEVYSITCACDDSCK